MEYIVRQENVKMRSGDVPQTTPKEPLDMSIVLSLAGVITVAAVVGVMALQSGALQRGSDIIANLVSMTGDSEKADRQAKDRKKIASLEKQLTRVSVRLEDIERIQSTTSLKIAEFEDSFGIITGSIPKAEKIDLPSQSRLLEAGWNADEMVTRSRKKDSGFLGARKGSKMDRRSKGKKYGKRIYENHKPVIVNSATKMQTSKNISENNENSLTMTEFAVELSTYKNIVMARKAWEKLSQSNAEMLKDLNPRLLPMLKDDGENGRVRLIAGPIRNAVKAAQICATLRSQGSKCQERVFSHSSLTVVSASR